MAQSLKDQGFESDEGDYDYLLRLPMWFLCKDKMLELQTQMQTKQQQLDKLERTTIEEMWVSELDALVDAYMKDLKQNFPIATSNGSSEFTPQYKQTSVNEPASSK